MTYFAYFVFLVLFVYIAWIDYRLRIIPNWITFGLTLTGLTYRLFAPPKSWVFIGFAIGFIFFLYAVHFWAEGDVKLAIGLTLWFVPNFLLVMTFWYCIILLIWGIGWMLKHKSLRIQLSYPAGLVFLSAFLCALLTPVLLFNV